MKCGLISGLAFLCHDLWPLLNSKAVPVPTRASKFSETDLALPQRFVFTVSSLRLACGFLEGRGSYCRLHLSEYGAREEGRAQKHQEKGARSSTVVRPSK